MIETIHQPESLADALSLLNQHGDETKVVAGGQSLLVLLRHRLLEVGSLVALWRLGELSEIEPSNGTLRIGATVTQRRLELSRLIAESYPALREAAMAVASTQVRNKGTLGGNLCHADPTADPPAALIALGAEVEIASVRGSRRLAVESLWTDFLATAVAPDELLTAIHLPAPAPRAGSAYLKHSLRAIDPAVVGVGVWLRRDESGVCLDARIGLGGVALTPLRASAAEAALRGSPLDDASLHTAAEAAAAEAQPQDDLEASAWYRRRMVRVYVERAARLAMARAG